MIGIRPTPEPLIIQYLLVHREVFNHGNVCIKQNNMQELQALNVKTPPQRSTLSTLMVPGLAPRYPAKVEHNTRRGLNNHT